MVIVVVMDDQNNTVFIVIYCTFDHML